MSIYRLTLFTTLAMVAFAANSLLCRLALADAGMDAASFTSIRLLSGAMTLAAFVYFKGGSHTLGGNWLSATALLAYALGFSFAYISLSAATGALLLFGTVQATMIGYGIISGERPNVKQWVGLSSAFIGLLILFLPGLEKPPLMGALLMAGAGIAWAVYSLRGRNSGNATQETAGNFLRAAPLAAVLCVPWWSSVNVSMWGVIYALASGVLASGLGYAVWYRVLPSLKATTAATVQLSVPVIAALGGVAFLAEPVSPQLAIATAAILGGVAVFIVARNSSPNS